MRRIGSDPTFRPPLSIDGDVVTQCERLAAAREAGYATARDRIDTTGRDAADVVSSVAVQWFVASIEVLTWTA